VPALITDQLRKSTFGLLAKRLVSKISAMPNRPRRQHQSVCTARACELIEVIVDLFDVAAEIDGLANKGALQTSVRIGRTELVGFGAGKAGGAMGVVESEALVDFGIGPELGARPQFYAGGQREVEGLASKRHTRKAVGPVIGRAKRGMCLLGKGRLAVNGEDVSGRHKSRCGEEGRLRGIVEAIIQAKAKLVQGKVRADALAGGGIGHARGRIAGPQIFALHGPARRDRHLDARTGGPAKPREHAVFGVAGRRLRQNLLVVGPGETEGGVEQPVAGRKADAAAHRSGRQHGLPVSRSTKRWRGEIRNAADRKPVEVLKGGKGRIGLDAEHDAVGQHVIIAALNAHQEAAAFSEGVGRSVKTKPIRDRGRNAVERIGAPVRMSARKAGMPADIEAAPIIGRRRRRRLGRRGGKIGGESV
jgi:hypothetical protein